jgi:hypothetical protein
LADLKLGQTRRDGQREGLVLAFHDKRHVALLLLADLVELRNRRGIHRLAAPHRLTRTVERGGEKR